MTDKQPAAAHPFPCGHCRNPTPHTVCCCYFATRSVTPLYARPATAQGDVEAEQLDPEWHYIDLFRVIRKAGGSDAAKARAASRYIADEMAIALTTMAERDRALREALGEAIDVFEGMNDDEIDEELLPRLRAILASTGDADNG